MALFYIKSQFGPKRTEFQYKYKEKLKKNSPVTG